MIVYYECAIKHRYTLFYTTTQRNCQELYTYAIYNLHYIIIHTNIYIYLNGITIIAYQHHIQTLYGHIEPIGGDGIYIIFTAFCRA